VTVVLRLDTTYRFWRKANWVSDDVDEVFRLNEATGHVVVKQRGVYLVYAQVIALVDSSYQPVSYKYNLWGGFAYGIV